ncbi:MAG: hypothetical protein Q8P27_03260 [Candidatus Peregrinibacteria bacterium]|nr:hypothetical protein [Candidatus Peregrinibacteria bacterium]
MKNQLTDRVVPSDTERGIDARQVLYESLEELKLRERLDRIINAAKARDLQREGVADLETIRKIFLGELDEAQPDELLSCKPWNPIDLGADTWRELEPKIWKD